MFPLGDVTYPQIDQNAVSGKSPKNGPTSQKHNFFGNGRTGLVYDSFWPQGPPELKKIGLGWFPQLTRPPRTDSRFFLNFFEDFDLDLGSSKNRVLGLPSPKKMFENWCFQNVLKFSKNMILKLHFGTFTSVVLPIFAEPEFFEILIDSFRD